MATKLYGLYVIHENGFRCLVGVSRDKDRLEESAKKNNANSNGAVYVVEEFER